MAVPYLIMLAEALVILFELRALMQTSSIDFYHPATQAVFKLTEPVLKMMPFKNSHIGSFYYAGFIIAIIISLLFWLGISMTYGAISPMYIILIAVLMTVKAFGYLVLCLLLVQALTSWLPATRGLSFTLGQLTYPLVSPVQKIIPPIGMIDISLMIIMIAIFALNRLGYSWFGMLWAVI